MSWRASGKAKMIPREINGQILTAQDKLLLMILSDDYNEEIGAAWRSQGRLAEICFCTDRGVRGSLEKLENAGLIEVVHGGRFGNEYKLLFVSPEHVSLRNVVPQSQSLTGTGVPVEGQSNRNGGSENENVSYRNLEPIVEQGNSTTTECPKCGSLNQDHKCPGHLNQKQRDRNAGRSGKRSNNRPFPQKQNTPAPQERKIYESPGERASRQLEQTRVRALGKFLESRKRRDDRELS